MTPGQLAAAADTGFTDREFDGVIDVDERYERDAELAAEARVRIEQLLGPDRSSPEAIATYWRELAAWPEWSEWLPAPPQHPAILERWWD
jgi:hypothetical protein